MITSFSFGVVTFTDLLVIKFALCTVNDADKSSVVKLLSVWFWVLETKLVKVLPAVPESTVASIVRVSVVPLAKLPIVQFGLIKVPLLGEAEVIVKPFGIVFSITKFWTSVGPLFVAVTIKVTVSPIFGEALSTVFVSAISASFPMVIATLSELLDVSGSELLAVALLVVLVMVVPPVAVLTVALIVKVATLPFAIAPTFQTPEPLL